jgi:AraC family transcriptional regulator
MELQPQIETIEEIKLIGKRLRMSFSENKTPEMWRRFMPRRKEILDVASEKLFSVEVYPPNFFDRFDPHALFEKWAAVEVTHFNHVPTGMEMLTIPSGLYAIFLHKGAANEAERTYRYIFEEWLPTSGYILDARPHFAVMDERYKGDDPNSQEDIYIPIKTK